MSFSRVPSALRSRCFCRRRSRWLLAPRLTGVEGEGVGLGGVFFGDVLTDVPDVAVGLLSAGEGELVGVGVKVLDVFEVFGTIVGLHLETFDGFPYQFLLVVGTFEVLVDDFFPFFGRNRWEFGEQFVVFHYFVSFYYQQLSKQRYDYFLTWQNNNRIFVVKRR